MMRKRDSNGNGAVDSVHSTRPVEAIPSAVTESFTREHENDRFRQEDRPVRAFQPVRHLLFRNDTITPE